MDQQSTSTGGSKIKETKNTWQFQTEWGPIYVPTSVLGRIGNPERIKITIEPATD